MPRFGESANLRPLADFLGQQPPWSDFPIILLTKRGGGPERNPAAARLAEALGNVTFLLTGMRELLDRTLGLQIELVLRTPEGLPSAQVDAHQVELAILNLAINARDAMPDGGKIDISVDQARPSGDQSLCGGYVRVRVSDTGSGMDAETLKRAVEPFFSTKPVGKGTGLGLSMVHGLAVQLGGRLELTSSVGEGTTTTPAAIGRALPAILEEARAEDLV